jgi:hypothetical protein
MDTIIVTDWELVERDDFYLSKEWAKNTSKEEMKEARRLQKEGKLYIAYEVGAVHYAIFTQMDASQVFIDNDCNIVMSCESAVISNDHKERWEGESV